MGQLISSGSGNAKDGGNICHVHHQGQFFQRVILFLVHMASSLPFRESKFVFAWPRRIAQSKFLSCFLHAATVGERGVCVLQTCTDAQSACKTAPVGTTCPTQRSKWLRRCAFSDLCRSSAVNLPPGGGIGARVLPASRILVPKCYACAFLAAQEKPKTQFAHRSF